MPTAEEIDEIIKLVRILRKITALLSEAAAVFDVLLPADAIERMQSDE